MLNHKTYLGKFFLSTVEFFFFLMENFSCPEQLQAPALN